MNPEHIKALEAFPLWFQIGASLCFGFGMFIWQLRGYLNREKPSKIEIAAEPIDTQARDEMLDLIRMELSRIASAGESMVKITLRTQYRQRRKLEIEEMARKRADEIIRERQSR